MANLRCPNCGEYKLKANIDRGTWGCLITLLGIFLPIITIMGQGAAEFYGGSLSFNGTFFLMILLIITGIIIMISHKMNRHKKTKYRCENCKYEISVENK